MNVEELEYGLGPRVVVAKSTLQLGALLFSTDYEPDQFLKKMSLGGNQMQPVDKKQNGAGSFIYWCNTISGGYIHCVALSATTGAQGDDLMGWMTEKRKTILINAIFFGLVAGAAALSQSLLTGEPPNLEVLVLVGGAAIGGFVGYINGKKEEIETGSKGGKKKAGSKIGL